MSTATPSDPNRVLLFDTTLRDGEQSPGISLNTVREARDRPPARAARRRHHRGRLPDRLAGRLRGRAGDRPRGRRARSSPASLALKRADIERCRPRRYATRERPRIHTFISTSDIHIEHQLRSNREDVKGQARAAVAHAKSLRRRRRVLARWTPPAPTSSSPPRCCRSPSTRARRRSTSRTPSATRCRTSTRRS